MHALMIKNLRWALWVKGPHMYDKCACKTGGGSCKALAYALGWVVFRARMLRSHAASVNALGGLRFIGLLFNLLII